MFETPILVDDSTGTVLEPTPCAPFPKFGTMFRWKVPAGFYFLHVGGEESIVYAEEPSIITYAVQWAGPMYDLHCEQHGTPPAGYLTHFAVEEDYAAIQEQEQEIAQFVKDLESVDW